MEAHLRGAQRSYKYSTAATTVTLTAPSSLLRFLVHLALVHSHGSSNSECDTSFRMCGLHGGAALAAQGRAVHEVVHATTLPAFICTTPTCYRSSATAHLVVIPWSITAVILVYAVENFYFCYPIFLHHHGANYGAYFSAAIRSTSMLFSFMADGASPPPTFLVASHIFINPFPTFLEL